MKRIRKTYPEPTELADYRARFAAAPTPATWDGFKKSPERVGPVRARLREDQRELCAYCENRLVPPEESVEHFVARAVDPSRQLDWSNLLLCCRGAERPLGADVPDPETRSSRNDRKTCGHSKGSCADTILNPLEIPASPCLFRFGFEKGDIRPDPDKCQLAGIDVAIVERTLRLLNLRAERLNRARLVVIEQMLNELRAEEAVEIASRHFSRTGPLPVFFTTLRWILGDGAEKHLEATGIL
jgi:uncharacterized protein (TIGR02646 family)